jgi:hypothetical protein
MRQNIGATSSYVLLLHNILIRQTRHGVRTQLVALRHDVHVARLPRPQTLFGVVERLLRSLSVGVRRALLTGHDGRIVKQIDELARLGGEQDLLLGALYDGRGVDVVGFFELLAGDVGELGFGDERLGFGADELLFEGDELGGFGLFVFKLLDFVLDLWMVSLAYGLVSLTGVYKSLPSACAYGWAAPSSPCCEFASTHYGCPPVLGQTSPPAQQSPPTTHQACH